MKHNRIFKVICVFQLILGILSFFDSIINGAVGVVSEIFLKQYSSGENVIYFILALSSFTSSVLLIISWRYGFSIIKNMPKKAETGQILSIVIIGLAFLDIIISYLVDYRITIEFVGFLFTLCSSLIYYIYLKQIIKRRFWQEVRKNSDRVFKQTLGGRITEKSGVFMQEDLVRPSGDIVYSVNEKALIKLGNESQSSGNVFIISKDGNYNAKDAQQLIEYYNNTYTNAIDEDDTGIIGTIVIPEKGNIINKESKIGFYLTPSKLIILDDSNTAYTVMEKVRSRYKFNDESSLRVFIAFIESLISEDIVFISHYDVMFNMLESGMEKDANEVPQNFSSFTATSKKELKIFMTYYKYLDFLMSEIEGSELFHNSCDRKINHLTYKIQNLYSEASNLRDDAQQLQDIYQAAIDVRQNKVMSLLTIVTTIFMPLTIITGWYGMNVKMPEVEWKYSYFFIIFIAIIIILFEISIFKKKKWF